MGKKKYIIMLLVGVLLLISLHLFYFIVDTYGESRFKSSNECKLYYWEDCGLKVFYDDGEVNLSKLCWQLEGGNSPAYSECQVITEKQRDCWNENKAHCEVYR